MSDVQALLEMIARRAPEMMRCGGSPLHEGRHRPVTSEDRHRMADLLDEGLDIPEIASRLGFGVNTVCVHTRPLRETCPPDHNRWLK